MRIEKKAPNGKFRVIGEDTFDDREWAQGEFNEWIIGDFDSLDAAQAKAIEKSGNMQKTYVFDSDGKLIKDFGEM